MEVRISLNSSEEEEEEEEVVSAAMQVQVKVKSPAEYDMSHVESTTGRSR